MVILGEGPKSEMATVLLKKSRTGVWSGQMSGGMAHARGTGIVSLILQGCPDMAVRGQNVRPEV